MNGLCPDNRLEQRHSSEKIEKLLGEVEAAMACRGQGQLPAAKPNKPARNDATISSSPCSAWG